MNWLRPLIAGGIFSIVTASALHAEGPADKPSDPTQGSVEIRIGAVIASNSGRDFDPRLVSMHKQFNALFPYTSYQLLKEERRRVPWGGKAGFDIPGGRYVIVIPKEFKNDRVSMQVMVIEGTRPIVDTTVSLRNHASLLVGGPREPGGVLILSIGADTVP